MILIGLLLAVPAALAARIPVLLLDGSASGPYHNWPLTSRALKQQLDETGLFDTAVLTAPADGGDFSGFRPQFNHYRVVVSNYDAAAWPEALRAQFEAFVRDGGGFVSVHAADNAFPQWPAYNRMLGIGGWRGRDATAGPMWHFRDDRLVEDDSPGPAGLHGNRLPFRIRVRAVDHPIMRGLPPVWMHMSDELYTRLRGPGQDMQVLATAFADPANRGTGYDEPMMMALHYGKGRIFHTTLGHDTVALSCVGFITTFQRGVEWAATGRVTQKVPPGFPTADTASFRPDIAQIDPAVAAGMETR